MAIIEKIIGERNSISTSFQLSFLNCTEFVSMKSSKSEPLQYWTNYNSFTKELNRGNAGMFYSFLPIKTAIHSLPYYIVCHLWYSHIEKIYKANTEHAKWKFRNRVLWTLNDPWTLEPWVFLKLLYIRSIKRCNIVIHLYM